MEKLQALTGLVSDRWPILAAAVTALAISVLVPWLAQTVQIWKIPVVGQELGGAEKRRQVYLEGAKKLYNDGYEKFKTGLYKITTSRVSPTVVVHPSFLPELKKLPDHVLSMSAAIDELMEVKYTKIVSDIPIAPHTVKADLTPALNRLNPTIAREVQEVIDLVVPPCKDWTSVNIHQALLRIVAMVSGRVFIGPELCRDDAYVEAAINYTTDVMAAQRAVQSLRPWLRPFVATRLPEVRKLNERIATAKRFLQPVFDQRRKLLADPAAKKPDDMLQWLIDSQDKFPDEHSQDLTQVQLGLTFAAIHTTTTTATNSFYDIAALPEFVSELREEIQGVLAENDGIYTTRALQSMKKLDSMLKETLHRHPTSLTSFSRKVLKPFTLSNGQTVPAGVVIEVPSANEFPSTADDQFDPLRFYRLRQQAKEAGSVEGAAQNQFVSVTQNSLTFGYGRHACPGRFFAANEIKMIVANAIMKFDFKLAHGCTERYPNIEFASISIPDPQKTVLLKAIA